VTKKDGEGEGGNPLLSPEIVLHFELMKLKSPQKGTFQLSRGTS